MIVGFCNIVRAFCNTIIRIPMNRYLLTILLFLSSSTYLLAQTPEEDVQIGMELLKHDKFDTAFGHFMAAANHKSYEGMYFAGNMYRLGVGTEANKKRAYILLRLAADSGAYPRAYEALGIMYYEDRKIDSAKYFLEKSMEFTASSSGTLGAIYFEEGDSRKALPFFKEGIQYEDPIAMYYMGQMYYDGDGIAPDEKEAIRWLQRAAKKGYQPAQIYLEDIGYDDLEDLDEMDNPQPKKRKKQPREKKKEKVKQTTDDFDIDEDTDRDAVTEKVKNRKKQKVSDEDDRSDDEEPKRKQRKKKTETDESLEGEE